jgi:short-subunit dehydrogenase
LAQCLGRAGVTVTTSEQLFETPPEQTGSSLRMNKSIILSLAGAAAAAAALGVSRAVNERCSLAGRVALITGGSRGLGLELARELASHNCALVLTARSEEELTEAAAELRSHGARVHTIPCDLTDPDQVNHMVRQARQAFGAINILVNNAGTIMVGPVESFAESDFEEAMNVMFWGTVRPTLALLPDFLESADADIVNISSIGGKIAMPHLLPYTCAKFAVRGFSEGLQSEVRRRGVHVLTVTPGLMRTGSHLNAQFSGRQSAEYRWFALGATVPGISMEVGRAAKQIVESLIRRDRELTLTASANAAARIHGAFPELVLHALEWVNALLPGPSTNHHRLEGRHLDEMQPTLLRKMTALGKHAAQTQNEL